MNKRNSVRNLALRLRRPLIFSLILVGIGMILVALLADILGIGGEQGLGARQISLIGIGVIMLFNGIYLNSGRGRMFVRELVLPIENIVDATPVLIIAGWFGLLTGLVEVFIIAYRKLYFNIIIDQSFHFTWMTPVSELTLFMIPAIIMFIIMKIWASFNYLLPAVLIFSFLGFISIIFMFPQLNDYASILLSVGLAVQLSRVVTKFPARFHWLVQKTLPGIVFIVIMFGAFMIVVNP